jgi:hypothetical protein
MNRYLITAALTGDGSRGDPFRPDLKDLGFVTWGRAGDAPDGEMLLEVETDAPLAEVEAISIETVHEVVSD